MHAAEPVEQGGCNPSAPDIGPGPGMATAPNPTRAAANRPGPMSRNLPHMPAAGRPIVDQFSIKKGDTLPAIEATLLDGRGVPIPLAGCSVKFHMRERDTTGTAKIDAAATVLDVGTDDTLGGVRYEWADDDTDTAGVFDAEFEITTGANKKLTCPNGGNLTVTITDDLA